MDGMAEHRIIKDVPLPARIPGQGRAVLTCSCGAATNLAWELVLGPAEFTCHGCGTAYTWPQQGGDVGESAT
jgi:hypothetical protein